MSVNVIEKPSVYPVGHQQVNVPVLDAFLAAEGAGTFRSDATKAGEELVEVAGRLCYMSFKKPRSGGNKAYVEHILEVAHGSVLEHSVHNLIVTGISRSLSHELVRHRVGLSPSQLSQRYVDESDVAFVVPPAYLESVRLALKWEQEEAPPFEHPAEDIIPDDVFEGFTWLTSCRTSLSHYRHLVDEHGGDPAKMTTARKKQVREAARSVLPNCTETKIFLTGNARAWRHFLELRGSAGADAEIRRLAHAVLAVLVVESPAIFGDYSVMPVDGVETIHTKHRKV